MANNLISYIGFDKIENDNYKIKIPYKLEGNFKIDDSIDTLHSFSLAKEHIDTKVLEIFEETNFENKSFFGNLIIINNKFELSFEYSTVGSISTLNIAHHTLHSSTHTSIEDYYFQNLDVSIFTNDLFCTLVNENEIYYYADLTIFVE